MRKRNNYYKEIELEATRILTAVKHQEGPLGERRIRQIAEHLGFELVYVPNLPHSTRSLTDLKNHKIFLPDTGWGDHDPRTIILQALGHQVLQHQPPTNFADFLRQRVEVNYFAAALLISESSAVPLLERAKQGRYIAIEDLRDAFSVSYETAAHRFTNLATEHLGLQVHFLRVHETGTIYKAYENDNLLLPADSLGSIEGHHASQKIT
jgi:predicted transcriptional regulator